MILLEPGNRILGETCMAQLKWAIDVNSEESERKRPAVDIRLWDFDDVSYRVQIDPQVNANDLIVSMNLPCYDQIKDFGGEAAIEASFPGCSVDPVEGFNITLKIDLTKHQDEASQDEMGNKLKLMKSIVVGGAFRHQFAPVQEGKTPNEPFKFSIRSDTSVYFVPSDDRVIVIFGLDFVEKVDKVIARIFMQEFVDSRMKAGMGSTPPCTFGVDPPRELQKFGINEPTGNLGFISFAILKSHLTGAKMEKIIPIFQTFRNYVQYHIKSAKTFFHQCMRGRVVELLKVINRAKVDQIKEKKTAQGKSFKQK